MISSQSSVFNATGNEPLQMVADDGVILGEFLAQHQNQVERGASTWLGSYGFREHYEVRPKPQADR